MESTFFIHPIPIHPGCKDEKRPNCAGMFLHVIPTTQFMTDTLCILVRRPLSREEVTANALIPPVLACGSSAYPTRADITLAAERMRGSIVDTQIIKKSEQQIMQCYFEGVSDPALRAEGPSFLHEIMLQPLTECGGFKPSYVRSEANNLRKRIEGRINHKNEYAKLQCFARMCEHEPFGLYGDGYVADLDEITPDGLLRQYKKMIATSVIDVIALGTWDMEQLREQLASMFKVYREETVHLPTPVVKPGRSSPCIERLQTGAGQGSICIGLRGVTDAIGDGFMRMQLLNELLGGFEGRLFTQARVKEGLCYYIQSFMDRYKGIMHVSCGAEPACFERIVAIVQEEMDALKTGAFATEALDNAKRSLLKRWRSVWDRPSGIVDFYMSQYLAGDTDSPEQMLARAMHVTREDITETARLFSMDTAVIVE